MLQGNTYYIVPWTNVWTQKVTGSGQILTSATNPCDPGNLCDGELSGYDGRTRRSPL